MLAAELQARVESALRQGGPTPELDWVPAPHGLERGRRLWVTLEAALRHPGSAVDLSPPAGSDARLTVAREGGAIVTDAQAGERRFTFDELATHWQALCASLRSACDALDALERSWAEVLIATIDRADALRRLAGSEPRTEAAADEPDAIVQYERATGARWPFPPASIVARRACYATSFGPIEPFRGSLHHQVSALLPTILRAGSPRWALLVTGSDAALAMGSAGQVSVAREALAPSMRERLFSAAPARASFEFIARHGSSIDGGAFVEFGAFQGVED